VSPPRPPGPSSGTCERRALTKPPPRSVLCSSHDQLIIGVRGAYHVTDHVTGKVSLVPGLPINDFTVLQAAVLPSLVTDTDAIHAPVIAAAGASFLLPALVDDSDTIAAPALGTSASLLPTLVTDTEAIYAVPSVIADAPGHGLQRLRPSLVTDLDDPFKTPLIGASVKPNAFVPADDVVYAAANVSTVGGSAFVPSDDVVYSFVTTLFVQPSFMASDDAIPNADVGWHLRCAGRGQRRDLQRRRHLLQRNVARRLAG
jgi:hypothetical protein